MLMAIGVWVFDWVIRAFRVARNGVKRAYVTKIDDDYLRVDIPGLDSHGHVYLYFPSLNWRLWESHPFSVIGHSSLAAGPASASAVQTASEATEKTTPEGGKEGVAASSMSASSELSVHKGPVGTTLYIRLQTGTTQPLAKQAVLPRGVPVLIESSYGGESKLYPGGGHARPSAAYPNLITIAGGVGITAVLPVLSHAQSLYAPLGSKKLFWGVRSGSEGLVSSVQSVVAASGTPVENTQAPVAGRNLRKWGDVNVEISVGERFDIRRVLEAEVSGDKGGTVVLVCGPAGMADEVRNVVTSLARHGAVIRYVEEAFAW